MRMDLPERGISRSLARPGRAPRVATWPAFSPSWTRPELARTCRFVSSLKQSRQSQPRSRTSDRPMASKSARGGLAPDARLIALNARLRACRKCHLAGYLDERDRSRSPATPSPTRLSPDPPDRPGSRPSRHAARSPIRGIAGEKLRDWLEQGGIPREISLQGPLRRDHPLLPRPRARSERRPRSIAPGTSPLPPVARRADRRDPAQDGAPRRPAGDPHFLGPVASLTAVVGTSRIRDGVLYIPLPHPSGVSRWLNEPDNLAAVDRAMELLRPRVNKGIEG